MSVKTYPNLEVTLDSGIHLSYAPQLDGGGLEARYDFLDVLQLNIKKTYKHAFEWAAGFGVTGFELIGRHICENIHFSDIFPLAIETCLNNAKKNNIENNVFGYISDNISTLPVENLFDLVVANGPCSFDLQEYTISRLECEKLTSTDGLIDWDVDIRLGVDDNCLAHKEFFNNISKKITKDADILMVVNTGKPFMLLETAIENGFILVKKYPIVHFSAGGELYHFKLK